MEDEPWLFSGVYDIIWTENGKKDGAFTPEMVDFTAVREGAEDIRFIDVCLRSQKGGNIWIEL